MGSSPFLERQGHGVIAGVRSEASETFACPPGSMLDFNRTAAPSHSRESLDGRASPCRIGLPPRSHAARHGGEVPAATDTIGRRKQDDPGFADALKRGKEQGKVSLRRLQWKAAQNGNITMLIWLGKQVLGQRDRMEQASSVKVELDDAGNLDQWDVARAREFLDKTRRAN